MTNLNTLVDDLIRSTGRQPRDGLRKGVLNASLRDAFEIGPLSSEPNQEKVIMKGEVRIGTGIDNIASFLQGSSERLNKAAIEEKAAGVRDYILTNCKKLRFSLEAMDFNLDTTNAYGESHEMELPFYKLSKYLTIGRNSIFGGLVGGAVPALLNYFVSGPIVNAAIWFGAIVGTVAIGAASAYAEAKDTTEISLRSRGILGLEKRIRRDSVLPEKYSSIRPDDKKGPCEGRAEEFALEGKRLTKQFKIGRTHLLGLYKSLSFLPIKQWAEKNEGPIFSSTIIDNSPGPTIALARLTTNVDGKRLGFEIAERYRHETIPTLTDRNTYVFETSFGIEDTQTHFL